MRFIFFCATLLSGYLLPFPLFVVVALGYVLMYPGYELLIIAFMIDAEFGTGGRMWFLYTSVVSVLIVSGLLIKPYMRLYRDIV